jgi:membrane peptidoglycan carboxypeptidase
MHDVVMAPEGTGRKIRVPGVEMAGKTGTAEFGPREQRKRHAWMIAFAPFDAPRYAVAMVVDEGVSGGETAAPRLHRLFSGLFDRPVSAPAPRAGRRGRGRMMKRTHWAGRPAPAWTGPSCSPSACCCCSAFSSSTAPPPATPRRR